MHYWEFKPRQLGSRPSPTGGPDLGTAVSLKLKDLVVFTFQHAWHYITLSWFSFFFCFGSLSWFISWSLPLKIRWLLIAYFEFCIFIKAKRGEKTFIRGIKFVFIYKRYSHIRAYTPKRLIKLQLNIFTIIYKSKYYLINARCRIQHTHNNSILSN